MLPYLWRKKIQYIKQLTAGSVGPGRGRNLMPTIGLFCRRVPTASVQWPPTPTAVNNTAAAAATALAYGGHQPTILAAYPTQQGTARTLLTAGFMGAQGARAPGLPPSGGLPSNP